jgi:hemoglobin
MTTSDTIDAAAETAPYEMIGGAAKLRQIVDRFYDIMDRAPEAAGIRAMHAEDLAPMRDRLFDFLSGWMGGPPLYFQRPDRKCIVSAHRPYAIGAAEAEQWMMCMRRAMEDCAIPQEVRSLLDKPLSRMADAFRNR